MVSVQAEFGLRWNVFSTVLQTRQRYAGWEILSLHEEANQQAKFLKFGFSFEDIRLGYFQLAVWVIYIVNTLNTEKSVMDQEGTLKLPVSESAQA